VCPNGLPNFVPPTFDVCEIHVLPKEEDDEPLPKKPKKIMMSLANVETSRLFSLHGLKC
jgi:hypothetical protein